MIDGLAMLFGKKKKARIRRDVEWRQRQSVEFEIHNRLLTKKWRVAKKKVL
jgi:hypothetical protein